MISPLLRSTAVAGALALLAGWACTRGAGPPRPEAADRLGEGTLALEAGEYETAVARFREVAADCASGDRGRRAVLLLTTTALDPRNPNASAEAGALLAVHLLGLPGIGPDERVMAETLYLIAGGYGAKDGGTGPARADSATAAVVRGLATRFEDCGEDRPAEATAAIRPPALPDSSYLSRYGAERDSLASRIAELEAELARIRALLQQGVLPDTAGG